MTSSDGSGNQQHIDCKHKYCEFRRVGVRLLGGMTAPNPKRDGAQNPNNIMRRTFWLRPFHVYFDRRIGRSFSMEIRNWMLSPIENVIPTDRALRNICTYRPYGHETKQ